MRFDGWMHDGEIEKTDGEIQRGILLGDWMRDTWRGERAIESGEKKKCRRPKKNPRKKRKI